MRLTILLLACYVGSLLAAPVPKAKPNEVTYKFKASANKDNGLFKEGTPITGQFTYDLNAERKSVKDDKDTLAHFCSERNRMVFKVGEHQFESAGDVRVVLRAGKNKETGEEWSTFRFFASDWKMPKGWKDIKQEGFVGLSISLGSNNFNRVDINKLPTQLRLPDFDSAVFRWSTLAVTTPDSKDPRSFALHTKVESLEAV